MSFEECLRVFSIMSEFKRPWYIAGGWALDLHLGFKTRDHHDIEVAIFREDQLFLKEYLKDWDFQKVENHQLKPWAADFLQLPVHELHASNRYNNGTLEVLLNEKTDNDWVFRRDTKVQLPLSITGNFSESGIPYLNPVIVLLYKSKNTRPKDQLDFIKVVDSLTNEQKDWLKEAIYMQGISNQWLKLIS